MVAPRYAFALAKFKIYPGADHGFFALPAPVIARSEATKQSRRAARGLLRFARNDGANNLVLFERREARERLALGAFEANTALALSVGSS